MLLDDIIDNRQDFNDKGKEDALTKTKNGMTKKNNYSRLEVMHSTERWIHQLGCTQRHQVISS